MYNCAFIPSIGMLRYTFIEQREAVELHSELDDRAIWLKSKLVFILHTGRVLQPLLFFPHFFGP